jgi:cysteinyl-tRNA synthetase
LLPAKERKSRVHRDFARSDEIRDLLAEKNIVLEDTKDGVRWKKK